MLVKVHRNLQNGRFSVLNSKTNRVVAHWSILAVEDAVFRVQPAGNRKAMETGQRNVHAYVKGRLFEWDFPDLDTLQEVFYNPFTCKSFLVVGKPITEAEVVYFCNQKCYVKRGYWK